MKLNFDSPDGMCVFAGCEFQAVVEVSWMTSQGLNSAPVCDKHGLECWNKTVTGTEARDSFTIRSLP